MKVVVAPDSYKGTMTAREAAGAMAAGMREAVPDAEVVVLPVGDGGEGTMDAIAEGGERILCATLDPLGRPITAEYAIIERDGHKTAVIEAAAASGITLVETEDRDIMKADTSGTGLLIADAYRRGVRDFLICMGGTATCDGGTGAFKILSETAIKDASFTLLCDVENPLCGPLGAAAVFAPQKGATTQQIPILDNRLREIALRYKEIHGIDVTHMKYAGAAGGLAGMFIACYGGRPVSGIREVLRILRLDSHLQKADLVITGEGRVDATTLSGKAPTGILEAARTRGIPVALIGGQVVDLEKLEKAGFSYISTADGRGGKNPRAVLRKATATLLKKIIEKNPANRPTQK